VIELYAITDHPAPPLPDVAPLMTVPIDGLAVVCTSAGELEASPEALWRHEQVVEALMADRDLLPVRYGTRLDDEAAIARAVGDRRDELAAALDRVRGAIELSVRIVAPGSRHAAAETPEATSGAEYLRARARLGASHDRAAAAVHGPLSRLARASAQAGPRPPEIFRAAYLVDRDLVTSFTAAVARLQSENAALRILCTGPWPPYTFAER
jgi:hypothetical protein